VNKEYLNWSLEACDWLYKQYNITNYRSTVLDKNVKTCWYEYNSGLHQITIGQHYTAKLSTDGYREYDEVEWVWDNVDSGFDDRDNWQFMQVWKVVLHEFAHVLWSDIYWDSGEDVHGSKYQSLLRELIETYPWHVFLRP